VIVLSLVNVQQESEPLARMYISCSSLLGRTFGNGKVTHIFYQRHPFLRQTFGCRVRIDMVTFDVLSIYSS
jgi:hypothetical protein